MKQKGEKENPPGKKLWNKMNEKRKKIVTVESEKGGEANKFLSH